MTLSLVYKAVETQGKDAFLDYVEWSEIMKVKLKIDSIYTYNERLLLVESEKSKWTKFFHKMTVHNRIRFIVFNTKIEKIEVMSAGYPISGGSRIQKYHKWIREKHPGKLNKLQRMNAECAEINLVLMKEYSKYLKSEQK